MRVRESVDRLVRDGRRDVGVDGGTTANAAENPRPEERSGEGDAVAAVEAVEDRPRDGVGEFGADGEGSRRVGLAPAALAVTALAVGARVAV